MKIILTEKQLDYLKENDTNFNKTKTLVDQLFDDGYNFEEISKYTGLDNDVIILCLKDREMFNEKECNDKYDILYDYLFKSSFIDKNKKYDDGTQIFLDFDYMSGSVSFDYTDGKYRVFGYATLMWDGECILPMDVEWNEFYFNGENISGSSLYRNIDLSNELSRIKTMNDLIEYFNNEYFRLLKTNIDEELLEYKNW